MTSEDASTATLARRTGELFAALGNSERALHFLRRAHEFEPESVQLFDAIDALLVKEGRAKDRVDLYRAALDYRSDPAQRTAMLHTIADLERTALGELDRAIDTYRSVLEIDESDTRALDHLTTLYRERERFRDLADLYERRAEQAATPAQGGGFRMSLAALFKGELDNVPRAIDQYELIVEATPDHAAAIAELEALGQIDEHKARIVAILRPLYERADDWRHLISLNQQRLALADDRGEKISILREDAELWEKRGHDEMRALAALRTAFELDPDDGESRAELERVAEKTKSWDALAEAYEQAIETADVLVKRQLLRPSPPARSKARRSPARPAPTTACFALDESDLEPLDPMDMLATLLSDGRRW